ncbi:MAG: erythromycin esterase family protein [Acidobacteriota bacterium]
MTALPADQDPPRKPESIAFQVADAVCDRPVVLLGELPTHGEGRAFEIKAEIVDHLIDRCGFDALLFEAGVYDFVGLRQAIEARRATPPQLDRAIGGFWTTRELKPWRRRLFDRAVAGRLVLGGIDDQLSATADHARASLPRLIAEALPDPLASECVDAVERHLYWRYDEQHPWDGDEQQRLASCTGRAADSRRAGGSSTPERWMLDNLASYCARQTGREDAPQRAAVMAENVRWQRTRLPDEAKIVVWTATVHASRRRGSLGHRPMGERLARTWGHEMAVIGFTAFAGESSRAGQPPRPIAAASAGSLEAIATSAQVPAAYLDRAALRALGEVPSRLFGRWTSALWSDHFDGVIVVREEVAPSFDR